jgi:hypothetical protein
MDCLYSQYRVYSTHMYIIRYSNSSPRLKVTTKLTFLTATPEDSVSDSSAERTREQRKRVDHGATAAAAAPKYHRTIH